MLTILCVCLATFVVLCNAAALSEGDKYVLNVLALRDEPTGEATGPKSYHVVSSATDKAKHQPFIRIEGSKDGVLSLSVRVRGDAPNDNPDSLHPMSEAHFIETIFVLDEDTDSVVFFHQFKPSAAEKPVVHFSFPVSGEEVHKLVPYEFCNLHGLWRGPSLTVGPDAGAAADAAVRASERAI
jgi:desulfoferrodoxin-like iron-binding protein